MDLISLMGKDGQIQLSIIHYLLRSDMTTSVSSMLKELAISRFIFENHIESLALALRDTDIGLELTYDKSHERITLTKQNDTALDRLYYYYLDQSIDYKILNYLYLHPKFSITKLSTHLALSEAAVYRKINTLNKWISDFEITIKRGEIVGSELQICYFFFKLFWNAIPLEEIKEKVNDQNSLRFVTYLEKRLNQQFSLTSKVKLYLWIRISKTRLTAHDSNTKKKDPIIENFLANQIDDPLYLIIKEAYLLSLSHSASLGSKYKAIYLYFFISSVFILGADSAFFSDMGYWPTLNTKVIEMNELVTKKVKEAYGLSIDMINPEFIKNWKYILTQINGILFYFKGNITVFDDAVLNKDLLATTIHTPDFKLANDIVLETEILLGSPILGTIKQLISRIHLYFIYEMRRFSQKNLKIGVICSRDYLQTFIMLQNIKAEFENKLPITCEIAKLDEDYDLLISDSKSFTVDYSYEELYIITDFKTTADSNILLSLLKQLLAKGEA